MATENDTDRPTFKVTGDWGDRIEVTGIVQDSVGGRRVLAVDIYGSRGGHRGRVILDSAGVDSLIQGLEHAHAWQVS